MTSPKSLCEEILDQIAKVVVGQKVLVHRLVTALLARGHVLIEGVPGLAKTLTVKALARSLNIEFKRIQFTPDLLPSDLTGTQVYNPKEGSFSIYKGPIHSNIVLADEINRAPSKVQSALLEAMEEGQTTIGNKSFALPEPFMVVGTQNPIEQEGTYPLPEAELDRFMFKIHLDYPGEQEERYIAVQKPVPALDTLTPVLDASQILVLQKEADKVYLSQEIVDYVVRLIRVTRPKGSPYEIVKQYVEIGASPRAAAHLTAAARAWALTEGRDFVLPDDVKAIATDLLRHRLVLGFQAEMEGVTSDSILEELFSKVPIT